MAVVTEAFDIPLDIMTKLATGEYRRIGGVVRVAMGPNKGQIVKHLKPVKLEQAAQAQNVGAKVLQFAKNNKKGLIIGTVVAGTITAGGVVYHKIKNREPEVVKKYHAALRDYINDIRSGELSMKSINRLMDALDELKQNKNYEKIKIELTTEELNVLVNRIYEYTIKLASENAVELTDDELRSSDNTILNLIAEKGLLRGESSIVQLPTGVGKTRSIELIIRAAFLSERANIAIIVAPLRALCNEITMDMYKAFGNDVTINQFSDVLQNDFWNLFSEDIKRQILICTPEKLSYVLHHDPFFLSAIDLFVFDEGHMFDDGGRGTTYELLVTHIRQNITSEQQLVLLSAVLPNSGDIAQWLFEDRGCLATDDSIVSTPKSIGFSSIQRDIHFFSDDKSNEDYYIPRILRVDSLADYSHTYWAYYASRFQ